MGEIDNAGAIEMSGAEWIPVYRMENGRNLPEWHEGKARRFGIQSTPVVEEANAHKIVATLPSDIGGCGSMSWIRM